MRILVTGAGGSAACNFVDSLRASGRDFHLVGADTLPYHLELDPVDRKYLVPPVSDPGYLAAINALVERERIDFVHCQPDVEVAFWARNCDRMGARLYLPATDEVELCHDKMRSHEVCAAAGVPVPEAYGVGDAAELRQVMTRLQAKAPQVWLRAVHGAGSKASLPVTKASQAEAWIDYWSGRGVERAGFMVSEFLPGREFAWASLWHEGRLVTSQARERVEYIFGNLTPSGQTSSPSVARTVSRRDVNQAGEAAVRAVSRRPHGIFGVDMKENGQGRPLVTEINIGRFYTTSNFFAHAGLNMPEMYVRLGMGEKLESQPKQHDALPPDLYWVRMTDMGYKLVKGGEWEARAL